MAKIKIDAQLFARIKKLSTEAGYASPEEFIVYVLEKELTALESSGTDERVTERLKGLGYLE